MIKEDPISIESTENENKVDDVQLIEGGRITPKISDTELIKIVKSDARRYEGRFRELGVIRKENERYYTGKQVDGSNLSYGSAEIQINRILVSIETLASIITAVTPDPWVIITPRGIEGSKLQEKLTRHLRDEWEYVQNMQQKMERMIRVFFTSRFAPMKIYWDASTDDFIIEQVRPENIRFDLDVDHIDKSSYVIEYVTMTIAEAIEKFPESKEYLERLNKDIRSKITVMEYWGTFLNNGKIESFVCWAFRNEVLGKDFNPFWNRSGANHFTRAKNPYVIMNSLSTGKSVVDDTSLIEQASSIQDGINKRKRQIDANAGLANGILVGSAQYMSKATFDKIRFLPKEKIWLNSDAEDVNNALRIMVGRPLEGGIFEDMAHSIREIDNIFGTSATLRGERQGEETARGRLVLRDAGLGRQDLTFRSYEQVAEDLYNWMIQIMYIKYDKRRTILSNREEVNPKEAFKMEKGIVFSNDKDDTISKQELKKFKVKAIVKRGSTKPQDPAALQDMALTLMQVGQLDPLTFHEIYSGELPPDPRTRARRLFIWNTNPSLMFPEVSDAGLIDYEAIRHIENIIEKGFSATDELFDLANPDQLEEFEKHNSTHALYMQGAEIDPDLTPFGELPIEIKEALMEHSKLEQMRLDQVRKLAEQKQELAAPQQLGGVSATAGVPELEAMLGGQQSAPLAGGQVPFA